MNAVSCHLTHDKRRRTSHGVGDKAYSSQAILSFLCAKRMRRIAESKKNSKHKIKLTASDERKLRQRLPHPRATGAATQAILRRLGACSAVVSSLPMFITRLMRWSLSSCSVSWKGLPFSLRSDSAYDV